jgi:hypothetical protein
VLIILLAAFALLFLAYPAARWTVGYIYGFTSELAHIALSGVWRLIRKPVIVAGLGTLLLAGSIASPLQVITFPRAGRHRRPSRSRRSDTLVPFSAAQMRVIARELSMAAPELLDAPKVRGQRVPASLIAFLDYCWQLSAEETTGSAR